MHNSHLLAVAGVAATFLLPACGSDSSAEPSPANTSPAAVDSAAEPTPPVSSDTTVAATGSDQPLGGVPACDLASVDDVASAFGGTVVPGPLDSPYQCIFYVGGTTAFGEVGDPGPGNQVTVHGEWPGTLANLSADQKGEPLAGIGDEAFLKEESWGGWTLRFRSGTNEVTVMAEFVDVDDTQTFRPAVAQLASWVNSQLNGQPIPPEPLPSASSTPAASPSSPSSSGGLSAEAIGAVLGLHLEGECVVAPMDLVISLGCHSVETSVVPTGESQPWFRVGVTCVPPALPDTPDFPLDDLYSRDYFAELGPTVLIEDVAEYGPEGFRAYDSLFPDTGHGLSLWEPANDEWVRCGIAVRALADAVPPVVVTTAQVAALARIVEAEYTLPG